MKNYNVLLFAAIVAATGTLNAQSLTRKAPQSIPVANFSASDTAVCQGGSINFTDLSTNSPTSWKWYFPGGMPDTSYRQNPSNIIYSVQGSFPVALVATNGSGSDSIYIASYITVNPNPVITVFPLSGGICVAGTDSVCFTASGANNYSWSPSTGISCTNCPNPCVSPSVTTVYTVIGTNTLTGCVSAPIEDSVYVGSIVAKITGRDSICSGSFDTLFGSGGANGTNYLWSTGETSSEIVVNPTTTTTYSLTISEGSCISLTTLTVYPFPKPVFTITGSDSLCLGNCTYLTATGPYKYVWFDGFSYDTTISGQTYILCPTSSLNLNLFVINHGCTIDSVIPIKVSFLSSVIFTGSTNLCKGSATTICATGGTQYNWSTGATTSCITVMPPGSITYTVEISNGACYKDTTFTIIVDTMPRLHIDGDTSICCGDTMNISIPGGTTYSWSTGATTSYITVSPCVTTTYTVVVTKGACIIDTTFTVNVHTCTGIRNISNPSQMNLFPSPATNQLTVNFENPPDKNSTISIADITGRILSTYPLPLTPYSISINVSSLSSGMYFLNLRTNNGTVVKKFVKE